MIMLKNLLNTGIKTSLFLCVVFSFLLPITQSYAAVSIGSTDIARQPNPRAVAQTVWNRWDTCFYSRVVGAQWGAGTAGTGATSYPYGATVNNGYPSKYLDANAGWQVAFCPSVTNPNGTVVQSVPIGFVHTSEIGYGNGIQDWFLVCCPPAVGYQ